MKKIFVLGTILAILATSTDAFAQNRPKPAACTGIFNGMTGGIVAVGVGVGAAVAAVALVMNNGATSNSH